MAGKLDSVFSGVGIRAILDPRVVLALADCASFH